MRNAHEFGAAATAGPSDRKFGIVFGFIFTFLPLVRVLRGHEFSMWPFVFAIVFLALALLRPVWLRPLNRAWMRLGEILHRIASPLIMAVLFYAVLTPVGVALRVFRIDLLRMKRNPKLHSYWLESNTERPSNENMKYQF